MHDISQFMILRLIISICANPSLFYCGCFVLWSTHRPMRHMLFMYSLRCIAVGSPSSLRYASDCNARGRRYTNHGYTHS